MIEMLERVDIIVRKTYVICETFDKSYNKKSNFPAILRRIEWLEVLRIAINNLLYCSEIGVANQILL